MQYWHFSETAYPYLPPEETFDSIRVKLPNGVIDPERAMGLWDRYLKEWQVADEAGLAEVVRPAMIMESSTPVYEALARSREASEQLVVVCHDGVPAGVVTIADMMRRVLPLGMGAEAEPAG